MLKRLPKRSMKYGEFTIIFPPFFTLRSSSVKNDNERQSLVNKLDIIKTRRVVWINISLVFCIIRFESKHVKIING